MRVTRPIRRTWGHRHPLVRVTAGGGRPLPARVAADLTRPLSFTDAGPAYKGMDPSDPRTYVRPWNPQPGMIGYLNFDGAQLQGRVPTGGVQRGSQRRGARGTK